VCMSTLLLSLLLVTLGLEEKVGQMLMTHFHTIEDAKKLIEEAHIGGVIYYNWSNDLTSPENVKETSDNLQRLAHIPLLIAIDQEGGVVARLKEGFTTFPGARLLGLTDDPDLAKDIALAMGQEMRAVGINLNLAPVVDIAETVKSPLLRRSFGNSPEKVVLFAEKVLEGFRESGVFSCLKHFPGHGSVESDSHHTLPVQKKTKDELLKSDLVPFSLLAKYANTIMTGHIMVPELDSEKCGTLSSNILGLLREKIGFDGVIITDSLVMKGVLEQADSVLDAAIQSIQAGADIVLLGGKQLNTEGELELTATDVCNIHQGILAAVNRGDITEERIDQSAKRIAALKEKYTPYTQHFEKHEVIADRALTALLKNHSIALGEKIWKNECGGTIDGLTHWNKGEEFGSFGIGHFIWYPENSTSPFDQTFPSLIAFLEKEGCTLPAWLKSSSTCPWNSRDQFSKELKSEKMVALRQFLFETKDKQALYIAYRLKDALPKILEDLPEDQKVRVKTNFFTLLADPQGVYALVDYLNFKGAGTSASETYQGRGWGLKQVLMATDGKLDSFITSAKKVLTERIDNSPKERGEERWLKGWLARIDSYQ